MSKVLSLLSFGLAMLLAHAQNFSSQHKHTAHRASVTVKLETKISTVPEHKVFPLAHLMPVQFYQAC